MSDQTTFVVVPVASRAEIDRYVRENVVPGSRDSVRVLTDEAYAELITDKKKQVASNIADEIYAFEANQQHAILIDRNAKCDDRALRKSWIDHGNNRTRFKKVTPDQLRRELKIHLGETSAFWRDHANGQIAKFDGKKMHLDAWLQQFGELGVAPLGRRLAMQLRVVRLGDLNSDPFAPRAEDQLGQRQFHCYVRDDDPGGSWVSIQDAVCHGHPPGRVREISWDKETKTLHLPEVDADEVVICEDGLWSGTETIDRLQAIGALPPRYLLRLKFAVVTDFGLLVARHAIRSLGMRGRVLVDTVGSELMRFLRHDLSDEAKFGDGMSIEGYFKMLHDFTVPHAFRNQSDGPASDKEVCREIGSQLVTQWLRRSKGAEPTSEATKRFELGGGRFASTTLFSRSIPKTCLPLLWLDGHVELGGKKVSWKPLFIDARRVGDETLLS